MEELKISLEAGIRAIKNDIVQVQEQMDKLWKESLEETDYNKALKLKCRYQIKENSKYFFYGYLEAHKNILEKIKELESKEQQEFEKILEEVPTDLKIGLVEAELPF